jgi:hypothetical protein
MTDEEKDAYIFGILAEDTNHPWDYIDDLKIYFDDMNFYLQIGFIFGLLFALVLWLSYLWALHIHVA